MEPKTDVDDAYWTYEYDVRYRLTQAQQYNSSNQLLYTFNYTYDKAGNMLTKSEVIPEGGSYYYSYEHNAANELTKETEGGSTVTNFSYDAWGRMYSKAQGSATATYAYKYGDKLVSISSNFPDEGTVYYKYGGDGKRRERSTPEPASYTWYNWSGWNVISEEDSGGDLQMIYVGRLAHIEEITPSGGTYRYYFHDHLGSVRNVKNEDKSLYASYEYTPYGHVYDHSGSDVKHRFTGQEWDDAAQLYYFPFRYYSPGIGRWITLDPLGGLNAYLYCAGNAVSFIDPFGLTEEEVQEMIQWLQDTFPDGIFDFEPGEITIVYDGKDDAGGSFEPVCWPTGTIHFSEKWATDHVSVHDMGTIAHELLHWTWGLPPGERPNRATWILWWLTPYGKDYDEWHDNIERLARAIQKLYYKQWVARQKRPKETQPEKCS